jgi:hypothetical protein
MTVITSSNLIEFIIKVMKYEYLHTPLSKYDTLGNIFKNILPSSYYDTAAKIVYQQYIIGKSEIDINTIFEQIDINIDLIDNEFIINLLDIINDTIKFYKKLRKIISIKEMANQNIKNIFELSDNLENKILDISSTILENDDISKFKNILIKFVELIKSKNSSLDIMDQLIIKIINILIIDNRNYVSTLREIISKTPKTFKRARTIKYNDDNRLFHNAKWALSPTAREKLKNK